MGFTEKEIWRMTFRKLDSLFDEYCIFYGINQGKTLDDVIPEG